MKCKKVWIVEIQRREWEVEHVFASRKAAEDYVYKKDPTRVPVLPRRIKYKKVRR